MTSETSKPEISKPICLILSTIFDLALALLNILNLQLAYIRVRKGALPQIKTTYKLIGGMTNKLQACRDLAKELTAEVDKIERKGRNNNDTG
jgi:hypothetical protein